MNSLRTRERIFEEMGLGPEWLLRLKREDSKEAEMAASDNFSLNDEDAFENKIPISANSTPAITAPPSTSLAPLAHSSNSSKTIKDNVALNRTIDLKADYASWEAWRDAIENCTRCDLCQTRIHTVPGVGDIQADWLFIGEGPGFYEDKQGEPFVGRSGKLLDNMMAALGMKRGEKVYIANIVKCRASDRNGKDRPPTAEESSKCMPYLDWQIKQIKPKIIVALGRTAAVGLLNTGPEVNMAAMRGKIHYLSVDGSPIPLIVTYHPSYLLRTPMAKKQAWADLCLAMDALEKS